jgi:hypothetical protein
MPRHLQSWTRISGKLHNLSFRDIHVKVKYKVKHLNNEFFQMILL